MIKISGPVAYFDIDDTLVYWDSSLVDLDINTKFSFNFNDRILERYSIPAHIKELKLQKEAGTQIIVWSKSGANWAEAIVKALDLEEYVDVVTSKPDRLYDDKDPQEWMPKRRYYVK